MKVSPFLNQLIFTFEWFDFYKWSNFNIVPLKYTLTVTALASRNVLDLKYAACDTEFSLS